MTVVAQPARGGYDAIVVGAGPAGMTVARKLEELTDFRVLIVESGAENVGAAWELAKVQAEGDLQPDYFVKHNQRIFGGTSSVWHGWCAVLDERPFLENEWPLSYGELLGYYPEAARILNVPPIVHERPEAVLDGTEGNVVYRPWYFSNPVRFGLYGETIGGDAGLVAGSWVRDSTSVDLLLGHTVTRLASGDGSVEGVSLVRSSADGKPLQVAAGRVVLATGGIQNARLLLLSLGRGRLPALGRYLVDHPHLHDFAYLEIDKAAAESVMDRSRAHGLHVPHAQRVVHGLGLSSSFSNERAVLSATVELIELRPVQALLAGRRRPAFGTNVRIRAEMAPIEDNNVALSSTEIDLLGQPRARVAMRFDVAAVERTVRLLDAQLVHAGVGRFRFSGHAPSFSHRRGVPFVDGGGHLMGTTRMGSDPSRSVTDAAGKVHGISNLYIAGSSLFPAASAANPTLTIVALALRLAEHLASRPASSQLRPWRHWLRSTRTR